MPLTTLQEEEDLFGASLSADFYASSAAPPVGSRPWQRSPAPPAPATTTAVQRAPVRPGERKREPHELLDDVPPASASRYPIDDVPDDALDGSEAAEAFSVPSKIDAPDAPYSPDDDGSFELNSKASSKYSSLNHDRGQEPELLSLVESRSDSEVSEYVPMHEEHEREEREEAGSKDGIGGSAASKEECKASVSSFDRLYDDEATDGISAGTSPYTPWAASKGVNNSPGFAETPAAGTPASEAGAEVTPEEDPRWAKVRSPGFTPESAADVEASAEAWHEATPEEDPKWAHIKVDVKAPTPPRSNARGPSSPYERCDEIPDDSPSDEALDSPREEHPMEASDEDLFASPASPNLPGVRAPPAVERRTDIVRGQLAQGGIDSRLASPMGSPRATRSAGTPAGTPAAYSFGSGIASTPDSKDSSTLTSLASNDSAIGALRSLQDGMERSSGSAARTDSPFDEPDSPMESSVDSPHSSPRGSKFVNSPFANKWTQGRRKDPPEEDLGYYPPNEDAKEPEGYRQRGLFPDIDLTTGQATGRAPESVQDKAARAIAAADAVLRGNDAKQAGEERGTASRYYEPVFDEYNVEGYSEVGPMDPSSFEFDDHYESMYGGDQVTPGGDDMDLECPDTGERAVEDYGEGLDEKEQGEVSKEAREASGFKAKNGRVVPEERQPTTAEAAEDMDVDAADGASSSDGSTSGEDVSVISDDTGIRDADPKKHRSTKHRRRSPKETKKQKPSYYYVKRKDSIESDIKIDFAEGSKEKEGAPSSEKQSRSPYEGVKRNDSMEKEMNLSFEEDIQKEEAIAEGEKCRRPSQMSENYIASPPDIERRPFSFEDEAVSEDTMDERLERSVESESASYSSSEDYDDYTDDESEASDDPTIFPSKAMSQMNLGSHLGRSESKDESEDLVEQACHHLSRGRNDDALIALNEAMAQAQEKVDLAKQKVDDFYFHKDRSEPDVVDQRRQDELEDRLDSDLRHAASEMADVLNNLGVVYELKGDYNRGLSAFRDALDAYRDLCHRYENADDADVDRTVSNILQMGIAMRSRARREELHAEAEELAEETKRWLRSNDAALCTQVRMERLNVLMCILDLEAESLGRHHPEVGYTLLKKGELHLEMKHYDMAIKDTRDACDIFKKSLGQIHPDTGLSLVKLADIYNYEVGDGYEGDSDNRATALSLYQEALRPLRESFGRVSPHLGLAHNSIGILYAEQGDFRHARASFYDALASYGVRSREEAAAGSGKSRPDVFYVWINVGGLHMDKGEWQLALRSWLKAQSSFLSLGVESRAYLQKIGQRRLMPHALASASGGSWSFEDNDALLAALLQDIGRAHSMLRQYGKAIEAMEEALRIHQVVAMRSGDSRQVARLLENLGEVQMFSGDLTSASERYIASLDLLRRYHGDLSVEVALVLGAIGQVHLRKGEYAEAGVVLKECMRTFEKLGVPPNNRRLNEIRSCLVDSELALMQSATSTLAGQRREISATPYEDKALAIDEVADAYRNRGDFSGALWFYSEALDIRRRRVDGLSGGRKNGELVDVGRTVSNIAQLRCERREFGAAKILFDEAKQLYKDAGLSVDHPFYRDLVQEIEVMRKM